jgi:hypothetical protein
MGKLDRIARIATDPRWWSFFAQRRIGNPRYRTSIALKLSHLKPKANILDAARATIGMRDLSGPGLHMLGQLLSPEHCSELVDYFSTKNVRDPYRSNEPKFLPLSAQRPRDAHIAHHDAVDILNAPYLLDLANDPRVLDAVGAFLGCKPTIGYMATWWSYSTALGPQQAENFHRDVDDWRFVKLFVYLTNVTLETGPHKYVLNSSADRRLTKIRRFNDAEVAKTFGEENIRTMTSKAGEGFLEDTYGIHKGQPVLNGNRLLFQVVYTLTPLPYAPKRPVMPFIEGRGYDRWTNRAYLK